MRIYYQPVETLARDWRSCDSVDWPTLGAFDVNALLVQGDQWHGYDSYSVRDLGNFCIEVCGIAHDDRDYPEGSKLARIIHYAPLGPDPDPKYGGAIRAQKTERLFAQDLEKYRRFYGPKTHVILRPWEDFDPRVPAARSGRWLADEHYYDLKAAQAIHGWREWTDGLHPDEIVNGKLRSQRKAGRYLRPRGTRTYYANADDLATGVHAVTGEENEFGSSATGASEETEAVGAGSDELVFCVTTPANEPNSAAWPTTGTYRWQIDATTVGTGLSFGCLTIGGSAGHFACVDSGLTADQDSAPQDEAAFTTANTHIASVTDYAWAAGDASDRFEALVAAAKAANHGNATLGITWGEADDFADGPWAEAAAPSGNAILMSCNT